MVKKQNEPFYFYTDIVLLQVLKLLAEMSPFCGDMDKLESNLMMLFEKLLVKP